MSIPLRDAGTFTAHMAGLEKDLTNLSGPLVLVAPAAETARVCWTMALTRPPIYSCSRYHKTQKTKTVRTQTAEARAIDTTT